MLPASVIIRLIFLVLSQDDRLGSHVLHSPLLSFAPSLLPLLLPSLSCHVLLIFFLNFTWSVRKGCPETQFSHGFDRRLQLKKNKQKNCSLLLFLCTFSCILYLVNNYLLKSTPWLSIAFLQHYWRNHFFNSARTSSSSESSVYISHNAFCPLAIQLGIQVHFASCS